jgi:hypothetical protein
MWLEFSKIQNILYELCLDINNMHLMSLDVQYVKNEHVAIPTVSTI